MSAHRKGGDMRAYKKARMLVHGFVIIVVLYGTVAVLLSTPPDPTVEATEIITTPKPRNEPTWTKDTAARYPECQKSTRQGELPTHVIVHDLMNEMHKMRFRKALRIIQSNDLPVLWTVGFCYGK